MANNHDMGDSSMLDLFRIETEKQAEILTNNLLSLHSNVNTLGVLETLWHASRSLKSIAKIVRLEAAINVAHALEECFATAKIRQNPFTANQINLLLQAADLLVSIAQVSGTELEIWLVEHQQEIESTIEAIAAIGAQQSEQPVSSELPSSLDLTIEPEVTAATDENSASLVSVSTNFNDFSMLHLFRMEAEAQAVVLNEGLLALETSPNTSVALESLMRAAHSIKGAARIVGLDVAVRVAHVMEDCFVAAQAGNISLDSGSIDVLLQGVDLFLRLSQVTETQVEAWLSQHQSEFDNFVAVIAAIITRPNAGSANVLPTLAPGEERGRGDVGTRGRGDKGEENSIQNPKSKIQNSLIQNPKPKIQNLKSQDRVVRVSGENLNRLMGLAGESLVEANWLQPFADSLLKLRSKQAELSNILEKLEESVTNLRINQLPVDHLSAARQKANECRHILSDRLGELELFARRSANLSDRLYREVIASHMRPFADGVQGFPRMIRDLARQLGKQVKLEIIGKSTQVDRDILEKLEAPLTHILRNAIDHGIELPEERLAMGKPAEGTVRLDASHRAGMLLITVTDDGRGVSLEQLRQKIVAKNMTSADMAAQLTETELMDFLFLPGFSTAQAVTEVSGRGVGLDVAQSMVQEVGGSLRAISQAGKGMSFHLQLPLTLSVVRTLLVEISGEAYAFPLTRIERIVTVPKSAIAIAENRQYFTMDEQNIGLVAANQVLEVPATAFESEALPVIVVSDRLSRYGLVVDRFLGERKLVVRPLDSRLGKVQDVSAAALMEDGTPVLIIDVEDMVRSIDNLLASGQLNKFSRTTVEVTTKKAKRVLVVDDSITVREMERKLLENKGYEVEVAVNGMDGWNALRTGHYDLVVTDIDMPRMNGIELVSHIKNNHNLKSLPVIIVSYKDREEDRIKGLEVGANYYLTKSSFHDDTLLNAVRDLVGEAV